MTIYDIVLVPFPFTNLKTSKKRPCVILSEIESKVAGKLYIVGMVTSQIDGPRFPHDVDIQEWKKAGLPKASLARVAKVVTLEEGLILKKIGRLTSKDSQEIKKSVRKIFNDL